MHPQILIKVMNILTLYNNLMQGLHFTMHLHNAALKWVHPLGMRDLYATAI